MKAICRTLDSVVDYLVQVEDGLRRENVDPAFVKRAGRFADEVKRLHDELAQIGDASLVEDLLCRMESLSRELAQQAAKFRAMMGGK